MYAQQIEGDSWRGGKFDKAKLDKMSGKDVIFSFCCLIVLNDCIDEQIVQLYELMQAIKKQGEENEGPGVTPTK
jgi:hypothetical protein